MTCCDVQSSQVQQTAPDHQTRCEVVVVAAAVGTCLPPAQDMLMRDSVSSSSEDGTYLRKRIKNTELELEDGETLRRIEYEQVNRGGAKASEQIAANQG
jgi:hypothetical protein